MKTRLLSLCTVLFSIGIASCGGGGGGGGTPSVTITPTPAPTPFALGDALQYRGTQNETTTFAYPFASPYPPKNVSTTISQNIIVSASPFPLGAAPSAGDFHDVETDAQALVSHTQTSDVWLGLSGTALVQYGSVVKDDSGDAVSTRFPTPYNMDGSATNTAAAVVTENYADGTSATRTYAADGSYSETGHLALGISESITQNPDGSGSYMSDGFSGGVVSGFTFSRPASGTITIDELYPAPPTPTPAPTGQPKPTPNASPTPTVTTAPAWFGAAPALYSDTASITANAAFPAQCAVPSSYGTSGTRLDRTVNRTDTILGYTEQTLTTSYLNSKSLPVCIVLSDVQTNYYDYQDDFGDASGTGHFHYHFNDTPLSVATTTQTLTLQSGAVIHAAQREVQSLHGITAPQIAAALSAFNARAVRARHAREKALFQYLQRLSVRKAVSR